MLEVVAALLRDAKNRILICKRGEGGSCANLWEFPGGKREAGETPREALARECKEELGIVITAGPRLWQTAYAYPDREISLTIFEARLVDGQIQAYVHTELCWVAPNELKNYAFCPADDPFVRQLMETEEKK